MPIQINEKDPIVAVILPLKQGLKLVKKEKITFDKKVLQ